MLNVASKALPMACARPDVNTLPLTPPCSVRVPPYGGIHPMHVSQEADEAGKFVVAYLVLLSTAINFALHSMISTIMNLIVLAVRFVENWLRSFTHVAPFLKIYVG